MHWIACILDACALPPQSTGRTHMQINWTPTNSNSKIRDQWPDLTLPVYKDPIHNCSQKVTEEGSWFQIKSSVSSKKLTSWPSHVSCAIAGELFVALQPASLPTAGEMCYKNYTTGTKTPHTVLCRVSPMHVVKAECFQLVACRHAFLGPVNYQPEISLLECSSGLLLLKPKPPPLSGLLRDPVFVFPEVMEPRCKLLYLWQQSLFLREEKKNIMLEREECCLPQCITAILMLSPYLIC